MALLIDTDLLVGLERGPDRPAIERLLGGEDCAISVITVSELLHGVLRATGGRRVQRRAVVEHLLGGLEAVPITEGVARVHAEIWSALAARGTVIGAHDLWSPRRQSRTGSVSLRATPPTSSASAACAS